MDDVIRVDYEELTKIGRAFDREADRLRQTFQQVQRSIEVLKGGDWVGQGASAFYREMSSDVVPAMKRLPSALEAAGRTTRDIAQNTKDAEDEIVRLFAGLFGLGSAAAMPAAADTGGAVGMASGFAPGGSGSGAHVQADRGPRRKPRRPAKKISVNDMMRQLDPKVKDIPGNTLFMELDTLRAGGWQITKGAGLDTNSYSPQRKTIMVGSDVSVQGQLHTIAAAYAENSEPLLDPLSMERSAYVQAATQREFRVDGVRIFEQYQVMNDLKSLEGSAIDYAPDTRDILSNHFDDIYASYVSGDINEKQAQSAMGDLVMYHGENLYNTTMRFRNHWDSQGAGP